jgi:hypothetical protein
MRLNKQQTAIVLVLVVLDGLVLCVGVAVVARPAPLPATVVPVAVIHTPTALPLAATGTPSFTYARPLPTPSPTLTASPASTDTEALVLLPVAETVCPQHGLGSGHSISIQGATYSFWCWMMAGHYTGASVQRFETRSEATRAFDALRKDNPIQRFHGYPATRLEWKEKHGESSLAMLHQYHVWQADRWLIVTQSFDDTHETSAPAPLYVSESVYREAQAHCLFTGQPCRSR